MKITNNVFALNRTKGSYVYVIMGKEVILIDTGRIDMRKGILKDLRSMGVRMEDIKHILLTHHDLDHVGNVAFLQKATGCKVWASKEDLPYILGEIRRPGIKRILESVIRVQRPEKVNVYTQFEKVGDVEIIPTPGHTPGHVCLHYKDILFAGDLVHITRGRLRPYPNMWNWDTSTLKSSIKNISLIPFKWICPAHGIPVERHDQWEQLILPDPH